VANTHNATKADESGQEGEGRRTLRKSQNAALLAPGTPLTITSPHLC
jgi:hypothetical protein